jgi:hypothetical protein
MGLLITLSAVLLCLPVSSFAATYYASKTGNNSYSCAQAQSPNTSKLTIQAAVNCATAPGDTVIVYGGTYTENISMAASGTSGNRITLQANPGDTVTLNNPVTSPSSFTPILDISARSWIRIQGFRFQGNRTRRALFGYGGSKASTPMRGIEIVGNTFDDNGVQNSGDYVATIVMDNTGHDSNPGAPVNTISGNTFTNNYGTAINLNNSNDWRVINNTGTGQKGSIHAGNGNLHTANYILYGSDTGRHIIEKNNFGQFDTAVLSMVDFASIRGDSGCIDSLIQDNIFHNVFWGQTHNTTQHAYGILLEARCHRNTVKNNTIFQTSRSCISIGHPAVGASEDVIIDGNVCYRSQFYGIDLFHAKNALVQNNIVVDAQGQGGATVFVSTESINLGAPTFRNNLYYRQGVSNLFRWGGSHYDGANANFSQWRSSSGDTNSLNTDPLFLNPTSDFHLRSGSPAIGAGFGGVHMGIYPSSVAGSAPVAPSNLSIVAGP